MLGPQSPFACQPVPSVTSPAPVSTVISWWEATGSSLVCTEHFPTISLPQPVFAAWQTVFQGHFDFPVSPGYTVTVVQSTPSGASTSSPTTSIASASTIHTLTPVTGTTSESPEGQISTGQISTPTSDSAMSDSSSAPTSSSALPPSDTGAAKSMFSMANAIASSSGTSGTMGSNPQFPPSGSVSHPAPSPSQIGAAAHNSETVRIVAGVLVPLVVIALGIAAFIIYKRRQRAHDRREWERTHDEIAHAVRQVGAATPATVLAAGPPAWGDVKAVPDSDPLIDTGSGGTPAGSLGHPNGSDHALLSHSRESSA
ncbi:hypothetical protein C8R45DRAFT_318060 [Mycena sanguinolenta]|nr:hypothetical protein C8R45DRAFT_318060 [Mycena sanguinolenta]